MMTSYKSRLGYRALPILWGAAMLWTMAFASGASAQSRGTIDAGTTITVRTNEAINASSSDGRVFSGMVDQDVVNRGGNVAIPRGASVEMLVRNIAKNQFRPRTVSRALKALNRRTVSEPISALVRSLAAGQ
jgi:hypothetical protein